MSILSDCCSPCPTTTPVNIPGTAGAAGAAGTNGSNAYSTIANNGSGIGFTVPNVGASVSVTFSDTTAWMIVGQPVYVQSAGFYLITGVAGLTAQLQNLGLGGNAAIGSSIAYGNHVSPSGSSGSNAFTTTNGTFTIPGTGANATLNVINVSWMAVGQAIFITGAGYFIVQSINTSNNTAVVQNPGYNGNATSGTLASGAAVVAGGVQGSLVANPAAQTYFTDGGTAAMPASLSIVTGAQVTLPAAGTWLIEARILAKGAWSSGSGGGTPVQVTAQLEYQVAGAGSFTLLNGTTTNPYIPTNPYSGAFIVSQSIVLPAAVYQTATSGDVLALYAGYVSSPPREPDHHTARNQHHGVLHQHHHLKCLTWPTSMMAY